MHKLECSAMCAYGENWCPSETVRLVARIIVKQVRGDLKEGIGGWRRGEKREGGGGLVCGDS